VFDPPILSNQVLKPTAVAADAVVAVKVPVPPRTLVRIQAFPVISGGLHMMLMREGRNTPAAIELREQTPLLEVNGGILEEWFWNPSNQEIKWDLFAAPKSGAGSSLGITLSTHDPSFHHGGR